MVAAEVASTHPKRRAWVGIYSSSAEPNNYMVRYFEVESDLIEQGYDIAENELMNSQIVHAFGWTELEQVLGRWLDDLQKLTWAPVCKYPI
jgi:hypothetical protein